MLSPSTNIWHGHACIFFPDRKLNLFSTFKQNPYGLTWCTKHVFVVSMNAWVNIRRSGETDRE